MENSIITKLKHIPNGQIGDGIFAAYEWRDSKLIRVYIGSKTNGPMLQYASYNGMDQYDGKNKVKFSGGCWTNLYSRGDFGKKYAFGGHWSGHNKNLHPKLMMSDIVDKKAELLVMDGCEIITLPRGIAGNVGVTEFDCSGSWAIWYQTASLALEARLTIGQIKKSALPEITKQHLLKNETINVLDSLRDVIEAYQL
jgi:hypothetical protein